MMNHPHGGENAAGSRSRSRWIAAQAIRWMLPSLLISAIGPLVVYELVRPSVHDNTVALAMGLAVPVSWTLTRWLVRRRLDPIGLVSALALAVACVVSALSGGNPLILELKDPVLTGALGMACLVSVLLRRPLHLAVLRLLASRNSLARAAVADPARTQHSSMITALVAVILLIVPLLWPSSR
jgi:hypothetical protein